MTGARMISIYMNSVVGDDSSVSSIGRRRTAVVRKRRWLDMTWTSCEVLSCWWNIIK